MPDIKRPSQDPTLLNFNDYMHRHAHPIHSDDTVPRCDLCGDAFPRQGKLCDVCDEGIEAMREEADNR